MKNQISLTIILLSVVPLSYLQAQSYQVMLNAIEANRKKFDKEDDYVFEEWLEPCLQFVLDRKKGKYYGLRRSEITRLFAKEVSKANIIPGRQNAKDPKADKHSDKLNDFKKVHMISGRRYTYHIMIVDFISFYGKRLGINNKYLGGRKAFPQYYRYYPILKESCGYLNRIRYVWTKMTEADKQKLALVGIDGYLIEELNTENKRCIAKPVEEKPPPCAEIEIQLKSAMAEAIQNNNARPLEKFFNPGNCYSFANQNCLDSKQFTSEVTDILTNYFSAYYNNKKTCCTDRDQRLLKVYHHYLKNKIGFDKNIEEKYGTDQAFDLNRRLIDLQKLLEEDCPNLTRHPFRDAYQKVREVKKLDDVIIKDLKKISADIIEDNKSKLIAAGLSEEAAATLNCYDENIKHSKKGFDINFKIRDCKDYSTVIKDYGVGAVVSPHAQVLSKLATYLLKALEKQGKIDLSKIVIEVTGLADGDRCSRCPAGQEIAVKYRSKQSNIKIQPISNFQFTDRATDELHTINFKEGDIIKTNLDLAAVRVHQVETEFKKADLPATVRYFARVSEKKRSAVDRGVEINIKFPDAYKNILQTSDITVENIINYMVKGR